MKTSPSTWDGRTLTKTAVTRFDDRIRVGGMAELFPGGDLPAASVCTGLRPMTPDSTPIVGATPLANLFLNTGHGTLGWTMACGSGKLASDLLTGQRPEIRSDGLDLAQYLCAGALSCLIRKTSQCEWLRLKGRSPPALC